MDEQRTEHKIDFREKIMAHYANVCRRLSFEFDEEDPVIEFDPPAHIAIDIEDDEFDDTIAFDSDEDIDVDNNDMDNNSTPDNFINAVGVGFDELYNDIRYVITALLIHL
jgi:hypothetical protein